MSCWAIAIRLPLSVHIYAINASKEEVYPKPERNLGSYITGRKKKQRETEQEGEEEEGSGEMGFGMVEINLGAEDRKVCVWVCGCEWV